MHKSKFKIRLYDNANNFRVKRVKLLSRSSLIIVLTGGIATGKSYISAYLKKFGLYVINSDELASKVMSNKDVLNKLESAFGESLVVEDRLNKEKLNQILFSNIDNSFENLIKLEEVIHPFINNERNHIINSIRNKGKRTILIESPLFLESNIKCNYNCLIITSSPLKVQNIRAMARKNMSNNKFKAIVNRQFSDIQRKVSADYILNTAGNKLAVKKALLKLLVGYERIKRNSIRY